MINIINNPAKLKWACRRGMLELDVLLSNFLEQAFPNLSLEDKALFAHLLTHQDPILFAWLLGQEIPSEVGMAKITRMIREHARSRF